MADAKRKLMIEILSDAKGAAKGFKEADDGAGHLSQSFGRLAKAAVGLVSISVAVNGIKKSLDAAVSDEASVSALAKQMDNLSIPKENQKSVEDFIGKLSVLRGVADDELRPAFAQLVRSTGDTKKSMEELSLAQDIAAARGISVAEAADILAKANVGNSKGIKSLGLDLKDANGVALTTDEIFGKLHTTFDGAGDAAANTGEGKLKKMTVALDEMKEKIGYALLPAMETLVDFITVSLIPTVEDFGGKISTFAKSTVVDWLGDVRQGFSDVREAFEEFNTSGAWESHSKFEELGVVAAKFFKVFKDNKDTILPIVAGLTAFAGTLLLIQKAQAGIGVIQGLSSALGPLVGQLVGAGPVGLLAAALVAIGVAGFIAYQKLQPFHDFIDRLWQSMQRLWDVITSQVIVAFHALRDAFDTVSSFITDKVIPIFSSIYDSIVKALTPLAQWIDENIISTFVAFGEAVGVFVQRMIDAWKLLWKFIEPQLKLIKELVESTFSAIGSIFKAFIDVTLPILAAAWDLIKAPVEITFNAVKAVIETTLGAIRGIFQVFKGVLSGDFGKIWEGFKTLVESPFNAVKDFIGETFNTIWDLIKGFPGRIAGIVSGMWDGFKEAFRGMINFLIRGWNKLEFKLPSFGGLKVLGQTVIPGWEGPTLGVPDIKELALGGSLAAGMPAIVGERGPELWVPKTAGTVVPNGRFGTVTNYIDIHVDGGDPDKIIAVIKRFSQQNGSGWLAA